MISSELAKKVKRNAWAVKGKGVSISNSGVIVLDDAACGYIEVTPPRE